MKQEIWICPNCKHKELCGNKIVYCCSDYTQVEKPQQEEMAIKKLSIATDEKTSSVDSTPISQQLQEWKKGIIDKSFICEDKSIHFGKLHVVYIRDAIDIDKIIQQVKELEERSISLQKQLSEQAEYTFDYQLRTLKSCGYTNIDEDIIFSHKYFMEMLVRPNFGDSEPHYEKIIEVFDYLEKHRLLKLKSDADTQLKLEEFKKEIKDKWFDDMFYEDVWILADKYFGSEK